MKAPVFGMDQTAIALAEVVVKDKKSATLEKEIKAFLDNPVNAKSMKKDIMGNMVSAGTSNPTGGGISISIDAIYELMSKEGKANRKAAELEYQDVRRYYIDLRYNARKVGNILSIQDPELAEFMKYCTLADEFVLNASDYDLTYEIFKCYREWSLKTAPRLKK